MSSDRRQVWTTLANLLARLERDVERAVSGDGGGMASLEQEIRKLGKTQFKANVLAEKQAERIDQALASLKAQQAQQEAQVEQAVAEAREAWIESLLPTLDGLDHAIQSGRRYLARRDQAARLPNLAEEQRALVSPVDRKMLASWLEGLRLVRQRLLDMLEAGGVTPIPAVGQPFDPHLHVAVATVAAGASVPGTVVAEERRGYRIAQRVLRYADVVVYRPESHN